MTGFLKVCLRGLICLVLLPFILLVWVLYGVYCLFAFIVMFFKTVIGFFAGEKASGGELKEDIEAKRILLEEEQARVEQAQVMSMMYQNMAAQQQTMMQQNVPQPVKPQPELQKPDFDPFSPSEEEFKDNYPINEEGGNNDGNSY